MQTNTVLRAVRRRVAILGFAAVSLITLPGFFKEARMQLPEELAEVERLPVQGRQGWRKKQKLTFGTFLVHDVKRSITKGSDLRILVYEGSKRRQTFSFNLSEGAEKLWRGEAETMLRKRRLGVGMDVDVELRNKSALGVRLTSLTDTREVWELKIDERRERPMAGTLKYGDTVIDVIGVDRLEGSPLPLGDTSGYRIEHDGRVIAAAEVINDGAVWISPGIDPFHRGAVSAALSAILLFEELRGTLPE